MILLIVGLFSACKRKNLNTTTTTNTTITYKDSTATILGSKIEQMLARGFSDSMDIGKLYSYYDSLQHAQLEFVKDSLGNIKAKCICNDRQYHYTYPVVNKETVTIKEVPVKTEKEHIPFWIKLLIGGLIIANSLLVFKLLFK